MLPRVGWVIRTYVCRTSGWLGRLEFFGGGLNVKSEEFSIKRYPHTKRRSNSCSIEYLSLKITHDTKNSTTQFDLSSGLFKISISLSS